MTHRHSDTEIEGLIFRDFGSYNWVATFDVDGQKFRCAIDFCPFCGERLDKGLRIDGQYHKVEV